MPNRTLTHHDLMANYELLRSDPRKFLEMANAVINGNPQDLGGYLSRHNAWDALGRRDLALADLDKASSLGDNHMIHELRGDLLRRMGRHAEAIEEYDRAESMDPAFWPTGCGPLMRAHSHAVLGDLEAALADCATLRDDHWTPDLDGAPGGTKAEITGKIRRLATSVRQRHGSRG